MNRLAVTRPPQPLGPRPRLRSRKIGLRIIVSIGIAAATFPGITGCAAGEPGGPLLPTDTDSISLVIPIDTAIADSRSEAVVGLSLAEQHSRDGLSVVFVPRIASIDQDAWQNVIADWGLERGRTTVFTPAQAKTLQADFPDLVESTALLIDRNGAQVHRWEAYAPAQDLTAALVDTLNR